MQKPNNTIFSSQFPPGHQPVGIGLRAPYYQEMIENPPKIGWIEVHPENYFGGGAHRHFLSRIRENYPLSLHAVGLSLGSTELPDENHLHQFKELIDIFNPFNISDHASWSASGNAHLNDLLPLPYNEETLKILCRNVQHTQDYFGRRMLVENPSTYIAFKDNDMREEEFMNELAARTGCGILLDINNIYVQSHNHGLDPYAYLQTIKPEYVGEMHLAGHSVKDFGNATILVDTHSKPVCDDVWDLFAFAAQRFGAVPTLIEWDQDFPPLSVLIDEARKAEQILMKDRIHAAA